MKRALPMLLAFALLPVRAADPRKEMLADFAGSLKRVTKKEIAIETESNNEMTFVRTRRTRFMSGAREVDGASLPAGIAVSVAAFERLNRELEAVKVSVTLPDPAPNK